LHHFSKIKTQKEVTKPWNQGFSYYFCLMIDGSGSAPLTNGYESGSRRPKNIRIRIRISNTGKSKGKNFTNDDIFWLASCRALVLSPARCSCGSVVVGEPASPHSPPAAAAAPPPWWGGRGTPPLRPRPPGCPCPSGPLLLCRHPRVLEVVRFISFKPLLGAKNAQQIRNTYVAGKFAGTVYLSGKCLLLTAVLRVSLHFTPPDLGFLSKPVFFFIIKTF
jgi:hypothetical protein